MTHPIHVGIGGWTFEPWRGVFYPEGLVQKRELEYAASKLTSIEINGTYYSTFKSDSWKKWRDETPDGFVFSVKASRYCTNRKVLSEGADSFDKFLSQGLTELGDKLGPINWQFIHSPANDNTDYRAFSEHLALVHSARTERERVLSESVIRAVRRWRRCSELHLGLQPSFRPMADG
jgi:uncharacterized protein YecE (DUF72 family)